MENVIGNVHQLTMRASGESEPQLRPTCFYEFLRDRCTQKSYGSGDFEASSPGGSVYQVLSLMVTIIKISLNNTLLETMQALAKAIPNGPKVTEDVVEQRSPSPTA